MDKTKYTAPVAEVEMILLEATILSDESGNHEPVTPGMEIPDD